MAKENGGVIGVLNTPSTSSAKGVWALQDQYEAKRNNNWPLTTFVSPNSARFNTASTDFLIRTPASTTNRRTFTLSFWFKRSTLGQNSIAGAGDGTSANRFIIQFLPTDELQIANSIASVGTTLRTTTQVFRDVSAWYHLVVAIDTTQATASNRLKVYINGSEITAFTTSNDFTLNYDTYFNSTAYSARLGVSLSNYFSGYISEINFIDGQALTPSSFGASNASGVWYPIPYAGSYGTNGFNLKFGNSASLGTDSSPNGNNWTVNNLTSVDQSTDSSLNNFATMNPLNYTPAAITYTEGNLKVAFPASWNASISSIGVSAGKWYWEAKAVTGGNNIFYGIMTENATTNTATPYTQIGVLCGKTTDGDKYLDTTYTASGYGTSANGDILGFALDLDSGTKNLTITKNGAAFTGGSVNLSSNFNNVNIFAFFAGNSSSAAAGWEVNYGSPMYAANSFADGNGYGNFSYAVPSGYYALCTANLNTYG
jgi:hypothetical protein